MKGASILFALFLAATLAGCLDGVFDDDDDGLVNEEDNCPLVSNSEQIDTDGDGDGDACDSDDDGDGVLDDSDAFPLDSAESVDTDGDGTGDNADSDDDGDGFSDLDEADCFPATNPLDPNSIPTDTDGDFSCDSLDEDDDGDGVTDLMEERCDSDQLDANSLPIDSDDDGECDPRDSDDDDDGFLDGEDDFPLDPNEWSDLDGDGIGDNADTDDDGDGAADANDEFPADPTEWEDYDGDGVGDNADAFDYDPSEWDDADGDGVGDNADWDDNGNGILAIDFIYFSVWDYGEYDGTTGLPDVYAYVGFGNWDGTNCNDMVYNEDYYDYIIDDAYQLSDWWTLDYDADDSWSSACVAVYVYDEDGFGFDDELDYVTGEPSSYLFIVDLADDYYEIYYYDNRGENYLSIELEFDIFTWTY